MNVAARLLGLGGFFIVWTSDSLILAKQCGQCGGDCKPSGLCSSGCKIGWKGLGCTTSCTPEEDCANPCKCPRACLCDTQFQTCTALCMARDEDVPPSDDDKLYTAYAILAVSGVAILFGLTSLFCFLWRRHAHGLRGTILSHPLCAKCPGFRDCLQRLGSRLGLASFKLGVRDSLDTLGEEDEKNTAHYSQKLRQWRRAKATVVGVKMEPAPIRQSATSGYKWKKKWRERKERSKQKRKLKHAERKLKREASSASGGLEGGQGERRASIILPPPSGARNPSTTTSTLSSSVAFQRRGSMAPQRLNQQLKEANLQREVMEAARHTDSQSPSSSGQSSTSSASSEPSSVPVRRSNSVDPFRDPTSPPPARPPPDPAALSKSQAGLFALVARSTSTQSANASDDSTENDGDNESSIDEASRTGVIPPPREPSSPASKKASVAPANRTNSAFTPQSPQTWTTPVEAFSELSEVVVTKPK
ncbi:nucleolar and coiled-body phosphoprotein 1-like isoform X2 [Littorina saxatilis]|uniref:nucleolar and coiled-body phosphoprotein 1-like isoform X2 n=1 Tax=Littorina saxatilis TaxID=31220 RepID=UPI0038B41E31